MKKTMDIIGFPVIDISKGESVGRVKDFIVNGEEGVVSYLVIDDESGDLTARVVSVDDILGIGEYAVTISNEDSIRELNDTGDAVKFLKKNVKVKGTRVLTRNGTMIGETGDIYIDENECCRIAGLEFFEQENGDSGAGARILPADSVITYGKNLIIVEENSLEMLSGDIGDISRRSASPVEEINDAIESVAAAEEDTTGIAAQKEDDGIDSEKAAETESEGVDTSEAGERFENNTVEQDSSDTEGQAGIGMDVRPESNAEVDEKKESGSAAELFEQRQKQYLVGRRATKTIIDSNGRAIVGEGMIINSEIIDEAKKSGKLVELVMNNRE